MSHFDERSGVVYCKTGWGQWAQTIDEVFIEVDVTEGTKAKDIRCEIKPKSISVTISKKELIQVNNYLWFDTHVQVDRLYILDNLILILMYYCVGNSIWTSTGR